jgi:hypothetical protein
VVQNEMPVSVEAYRAEPDAVTMMFSLFPREQSCGESSLEQGQEITQAGFSGPDADAFGAQDTEQ